MTGLQPERSGKRAFSAMRGDDVGRSHFLETALALIKRGLSVVPMWPVADGRPLVCRCAWHACPGACTHAMGAPIDEPAVARDVWQHRPDAGVAVSTGGEGRLWVLAVDGQRGARNLAELADVHLERLPGGPMTVTGPEQIRYWMRAPQHLRGTRSMRIRAGVRLLAAGDLVLAPPSPTPAGHFCRWAGPSTGGELPDAPAWLVSGAERRRLAL